MKPITSLKIDKEYLDWIAELSQRYRQSQIKASVSVNNYMLRFYWSVYASSLRRRRFFFAPAVGYRD